MVITRPASGRQERKHNYATTMPKAPDRAAWGLAGIGVQILLLVAVQAASKWHSVGYLACQIALTSLGPPAASAA